MPPNEGKQDVVAVIPAHNEGTRIVAVVQGAKRYVGRVVVVDDGSSDDTARIAASAGALVVRHDQNCGAGAATMTGIEAARCLGARAVVAIDGDGQHDVHDVPALLGPILEGRADIVSGNRFGGRNNIPRIRRVYNCIGNVITFLTTGKWMQDSQCGFKALGPVALQQIDIQMSGYEFCTEVVREAVKYQWRIVEVPIKVTYSEYTLAKGQSFAQGVKMALRILLRSILR